MGVGSQILKRIPRIKFPARHSSSAPISRNDETHHIFSPSSEVPAAVANTAIGGKASLQPKRTPVSDKEIESIMLGGCF